MTTVSLAQQGLAGFRYTKAEVIGGGNPLEAAAFGEGKAREWANTPEVGRALKANVDALSSGGNADLVVPMPIKNDFLPVIRARTVLNKIPGLRQVPANVSMLKVTAGAATAWAAEGAPRPISKFQMDRVALMYDKVCSTIVTSRELLVASGVVAELAFGNELAAGVAAFTDKAFLDPSFDAIPGTRPASISFGLPSISSTGTSLAAVVQDLRALFANFVAADGALESAVLIMAPRTALAMAQLTGTGGALAFPNLGVKGGTVYGIQTLTTSACIADGSPGETFMVLLDPAQILIADDGGLRIKSSRAASMQMSDAPAAGSQSLVNLWQNGLVAIGIDRQITWKRASDAGVSVLRDIAY
jgi:HK97 family phage major capsid protein